MSRPIFPFLRLIQRLHEGLGIPLESLLGILVQGKSEKKQEDFDWGKFPVKEMLKREWFSIDNPQGLVKDVYESVMRHAFPNIKTDLFIPSRLRSTRTEGRGPDPYVIKAWELKLMQIVSEVKLPGKFDNDIITADFRRDLARLSYLDQGPLLAKEFLNKNGIHLIILEHLPRTYLDGAALFLPSNEPVIGLTLRHNRLDNFWFNLFHELAHIRLHLSTDREGVYLENLEQLSDDPEEREADRWALDSLIPDEIWRAVDFDLTTTKAEIMKFAASIRIHHSIPAGRIRYEHKNFTIHSDLLGRNAIDRSEFQ